MKYFANVKSFSELKKTYRELVLQLHPDKGGDVKEMQALNEEFTAAYDMWKNRTEETPESGYAYNPDETARAYAHRVYEEYGWKGRNYDKSSGLGLTDLTKLFREFVKKTYPHCKFSIRSERYSSIKIVLLSADFQAFNETFTKGVADVNHYHLNADTRLTERCLEVVKNVYDYVASYNYDNSDIMTDYFDTRFYVTIQVGEYNHPFKYVPIPVGGKHEPKAKIGETQRAINKAVGSNNEFAYVERYGKKMLCEKSESEPRWPLLYSQPSILMRRLKALREAGCVVEPFKGSYIEFVDFTDETKKALAREKSETAKKASTEQLKEELASEFGKVLSEARCGVVLKELSAQRIGVSGNTYKYRKLLKSLGGWWNDRLSMWTFPTSKQSEIKQAFAMQ